MSEWAVTFEIHTCPNLQTQYSVNNQRNTQGSFFSSLHCASTPTTSRKGWVYRDNAFRMHCSPDIEGRGAQSYEGWGRSFSREPVWQHPDQVTERLGVGISRIDYSTNTFLSMSIIHSSSSQWQLISRLIVYFHKLLF